MADKIVRVRMPDGSIKRVRVPAEEKNAEPAQISPLSTALSHALGGATFQFADEIAGGLGKLAGKDYKTTRDAVRKHMQETKEANPKTALASEIAGGLATGVPGLLRSAGLKAGATVKEALPKLARVGAGQGGAYAYGASASDDPEVQARDAAYGAAFGGAFGAGVPALTRGAQYAGRTMFPAVGKGSTERSIAKILEAAGETPAGVNAKVAKGENLTPSDVSPALQQLTKFAATIDSPARQSGLANIAGRLSAQKQRVLDTLTGKKTADAEAVIQSAKARLSRPMKDAYNEAYKHSVNVKDNKAFEQLMQRPAVRNAYMEAMSNYTNRTGRQLEGDDIPVEILDKVSGVIGDAARVAKEAGEGSKMVPLNAAKSAWDKWLARSGPESLQKGRDLAHKGFQFEDAVRKGQDYLKTPMQTITNDLVELKKDPKLLKAYRAGVTDAVAKKLAGIKEGASYQKAFTPAEKKRLKNIMGKKFDNFWDKLKQEGKIARTSDVVKGNPHIEGVPSVLQTPVSEVNLLGRIIQQASRFGQRGPARQRREELIGMLTDPAGLKGIPTSDMIHAMGKHKVGGAAGIVPQFGQEPYPGR